MTGLLTQVGTSMRRVAMTLLTVFAVAFVAPTIPTATADPASDAAGAITAAWEAGGGATGPLGVQDGGVYAVGDGFGQNFAGGRIYFTPDTGARIMTGAILEKYLALGGPDNGDLGFPNIDEGAGRAANSRNTTFSAADNPVIFWTPDTGARVVRGAINAAWDKLGGSAGVLGVPSDDEVYRGDVVTQDFTGGQLSWNRKTGEFTSTPPELAGQLAGLEIPGDVTTAIAAARRAAGGPMGPLGAQEGVEYKIGDDGVGQNYTGGKIFYSPETGANVVTGQVLAKYESVGGPEGDLGLPTSSEADGGLAPSSAVVPFSAPDQPVIFWTPDYGAVIVRGAMNAAWAKLGGATGELGAPTADQSESGDVITQKFSGGAISWNKTSGEFSTEPGNLASQLAGLEVPGRDSAAQSPPPAERPRASADKWYEFQQWWLLAIVPVAILLIAIIVGVVLNRRRRDDRAPMDRFDDHDDEFHHDDYDDDDYDDYAPHGDFESGPLPVAPPSPPSVGPPSPPPPPPPPPPPAGPGARYVPASMWAMPPDEPRPSPTAEAPEPPPSVPPPAVERDEDESSVEENAEKNEVPTFADDEDAIDTAPTRIPTELATETVAIARPSVGHDYDDFDEHDGNEDDHEGYDGHDGHDGHDEADGHHDEADGYHDVADENAAAEAAGLTHSGRHAAIRDDDAPTALTSFRIASGDALEAPNGYPIKADTKSGLYFTPESARYPQIRAEIWFASEEFALTNGFIKG